MDIYLRSCRPLAQTFARDFSVRAQPSGPSWICTQCRRPQRRPTVPPSTARYRQPPRRHQSNNNPADDPAFRSIVDNPPVLVRSGRKHNPYGLAFLAIMPVTAFALGCWQVQRLSWKTELLAKYEDRLIREPLPLPPVVDPTAVKDFDYRRVYARGRLLHEREMLIGPRLHDGEDGYLVVTPLDRSEEFPDLKAENTSVLVNRGWIPKNKAPQASRDASALPREPVVVEGLLREPWKKNMFTPANDPARNTWHFPDIDEMSAHAGTQPVWIEETMEPDLLAAYDRVQKGIPIGRPAEVNLRNNHAQYIFTWFSLSLATGFMFYMIVKRPTGSRTAVGRVQRNTAW